MFTTNKMCIKTQNWVNNNNQYLATFGLEQYLLCSHYYSMWVISVSDIDAKDAGSLALRVYVAADMRN